MRQVALHNLSAEPAQGVGALVLSPDQGAHLVAFGEQHCGEVAADGADGAGRSGHQDRAVVCGFHHIADLKLRSESFSGVWNFNGQTIGTSAVRSLAASTCGKVVAFAARCQR
jgi:hypothetical protein